MTTAQAPAPTMPQTSTPQAAASAWLTLTWRLVRWNLSVVARRLMGKILLGLLVGGFLLVVLVRMLAFSATSQAVSQGPQDYCRAPAVSTQQSGATPEPGNNPGGYCATPTAEQKQQIQRQQAAFVEQQRQQVAFPATLQLGGGYTGFVGLILLCILAGTLVGGEYGFGTVRLALSRGVGRGQLIAAQAVTLAALALATTLLMLLLAAIAGLIIGPIVGAKPTAIGANGWLEFGGYWLLVSLQIFGYALIALFMGTWARSTAAAIAVPLGYFLFEGIAGSILYAIGTIENSTAKFLGHIPDWFFGNAISSLVAHVTQAPIDLGYNSDSVQAKIGTGQAVAVVLVCCVALIALSYLILRRRDVTD